MTINQQPVGVPTMGQLQIQLDRIHRRWWLVLLVMSITVIGTGLYAMSQPAGYTGTKALRVASQTRGPEQDAVLAQGYVEYFNQPATKQALRAKAELASDVTFSARNSASSPLFYIDVVAPDADAAAVAANKLSDTFRDEINTQVQQSDERTIADLMAQIEASQDKLTRVPSPSTEFSLILEEMSSWRKSINDIKANKTNQLMDVLPTAGVTSTSRNVAQNMTLALLGGLVLGVVAALAMASTDERPATTPQRLVTPQEVLDRPRPALNSQLGTEESRA